MQFGAFVGAFVWLVLFGGFLVGLFFVVVCVVCFGFFFPLVDLGFLQVLVWCWFFFPWMFPRSLSDLGRGCVVLHRECCFLEPFPFLFIIFIPALWYNSIHHFRGLLLPRIFLGLLPLKSSPNPQAGRAMTPCQNQPLKPHRGAPTKHCYSPGLRGHHYMSPPTAYMRGSAKTGHLRPHTHSATRILLHHPPSHRILQGPLLHRRWSIWINLLCCHWIPRPTRHHWLNIPISMPRTPNQVPFHFQPSLRLRSSSLILTLCRCRMTIPLHHHLLMRILLF